MAIKYLKKAIKNPSTDDHKTREVVQNILNDIEKRREDAINQLTKKFDKYEGEIIVSKEKKEEAIKFARKATSMLPIQKDYLAGPNLARNLAKVYAIVGEDEASIKELEFLSTINHGFYKGEISLEPAYETIRKDPRIRLLLRDEE